METTNPTCDRSYDCPCCRYYELRTSYTPNHTRTVTFYCPDIDEAIAQAEEWVLQDRTPPFVYPGEQELVDANDRVIKIFPAIEATEE